jgi:hypothetical protein
MHLGEKEAYKIGDVLHVHPLVKWFTYQCQCYVLHLSLVINSLCFFTWSHAEISLVTISSQLISSSDFFGHRGTVGIFVLTLDLVWVMPAFMHKLCNDNLLCKYQKLAYIVTAC